MVPTTAFFQPGRQARMNAYNDFQTNALCLGDSEGQAPHSNPEAFVPKKKPDCCVHPHAATQLLCLAPHRNAIAILMPTNTNTCIKHHRHSAV